MQENPAAAVENTRMLLGRQMHVDPATIEVVAAEAVEWPDACLGVSLPNEQCAQVLTPGAKLTFNVGDEEYVIHTDRDGYRTRVAVAPEPEIGQMVLAWGGAFDNGECMEAIIGDEGVAFGLCGGRPRIGGKFASEARVVVMNDWVSKYASFDAETEFGSVRLVGSGSTAATPAEQEMIGRWASMAAMEAAAGASRAGMAYWGPEEMGSPDTSKCATLQVNTSPEAGIGACDGTMSDVLMGERMVDEWAQIADRFAPFVYETPTETLVFEGMGGETAGQWQPALLAWARARHAELSTGRTSATINTAMSWHVGQDFTQKNICRHLTVLDYGYAYAEEILCEGLDLVSSTGDWLTNEDLAQVDAWLYARAPLYAGNNYIDGKGSQVMSEAEAAQVEPWAMEVWSRIRNAGAEIAVDPGPNGCPEARDGLGMVRYYDRGFCMLVPGDYTVFEPNPDEVVIAKDSLLNVTEPRLYITVTSADGRTAGDAADEIVASMPGFQIDRNDAEIAGQPAVVLDNVPGQDLNRRALILANDRIYEMTFAPSDHAEMEAFYSTIIDSFVLVEPE